MLCATTSVRRSEMFFGETFHSEHCVEVSQVVSRNLEHSKGGNLLYLQSESAFLFFAGINKCAPGFRSHVDKKMVVCAIFNLYVDYGNRAII